MITIYLTRHGQTEWNIDKRLQGLGNSKLTDLGISQAKLLRDRLNEIEVDVIYTSPLERALETAKILRGEKDVEVIVNDNLKEISFGEYEGSTESELLKQGKGKEIKKIFDGDINIKAPGGESFEELYLRVCEALTDILNLGKYEKILIVSHGMALKAIMSYFNKGEGSFNEIMGQATLTKIIYDGSKFNIEYLNDGSHIIYNSEKVGW